MNSIAPSDSVTPLHLSSSDMRRLAKIAKANQSSLVCPASCAAKPPSGLARQVSGASSTKSEPTLQRQICARDFSPYLRAGPQQHLPGQDRVPLRRSVRFAVLQ